ncbi:uncharacterized protein TRAVEDRAFT_44702 [Trametes versicolor FP-101664 SS1]|uniref:uncharacterized protein n=1 Tax=Trametes versicolor (strain FP-101664) TaxID=717944 RepID=UPI0004622B99|nr:uncharacterized protein TRAVEDRAFT_44702 [Trametes versicolor FP-101664 SS1]EIW61884.1 hypothetical protein TRAVEDRAFT_44702 [Trametes versicolor FP-101664 SS1]
MAKKKGPPYTDDPGCKYIVIDDPWPGDATGKARNQVFFNRLCTWVYFMLGKAHQADAVYSVNTRDEIIVQLPQDTDLTPILGAHPWRRYLSRGNPRDKDRVSYVFEYDYRNKGDPSNHNWLETFPSVRGDPPAHLQFPVVYPYPRVSWATPKGKNCVDLALPLPPTRQPTPIPDTSGFEPYQHPSALSSRTVDSAQARLEEDARAEQAATRKLGKVDPYDAETNALRSLKREFSDVPLSVKREASDVRVKPDPGGPSVKSEPELYGPSKEFRHAVERLQQARASGSEGGSTTRDPVVPEVQVKSEQAVKHEAEPYGPSKNFRSAVERLQQARAAAGQEGPDNDSRRGQSDVQEGVRIKQDVSEEPISTPSDSFLAAFQRIRGRQASQSENTEPPQDRGRPAPTHIQSAPKRVKEEDTQDNGRKRFKSESMH